MLVSLLIMNQNNLPENNQADNPRRIYESVSNFFNQNQNILLDLRELDENESCLLFNIFRSFMDELQNINDFDLCFEIYARKIRNLNQEIIRFDNYVLDNDNVNNYIYDTWQTMKMRYSIFRRTIYIYINFVILDYNNIGVSQEMIDQIYNQVNNNENDLNLNNIIN